MMQYYITFIFARTFLFRWLLKFQNKILENITQYSIPSSAVGKYWTKLQVVVPIKCEPPINTCVRKHCFLRYFTAVQYYTSFSGTCAQFSSLEIFTLPYVLFCQHNSKIYCLHVFHRSIIHKKTHLLLLFLITHLTFIIFNIANVGDVLYFKIKNNHIFFLLKIYR